jgi:hypothetical protein
MSKTLTDKQAKFLEVLFEEAGGDLFKAKELAGYSKNTKTIEIREQLQDEIIDATKKYLAANAPKAAMSLIRILENPTDLGNKDKLASAKDLLDRIGLRESDKVEVKAESPIFILPAKE